MSEATAPSSTTLPAVPPSPTAGPDTSSAAGAVTPPQPQPSKARGRAKDAAPTEQPKAAEEPPKAEAKPDKPKADEWARLTAAEKKARKEREQLDSERRAFAEERKSIEAQKERLALIDRAKGGDWDATQALMRETGLTYDALTKRMLSAGKVDKGESALEKIERLEKQLQERDARQAQEQVELSFKQTVDTLAQFVTKESADAYPILAGEIETNRPWVESVIRDMLDESQKTNTPITYAEAAQKFEAHLRAETERRWTRMRPAQPPTPPPAEEAPKTSTERPRDETGRFAGGDGPRRLTNRDSAERSAAPPVSTNTRRMTQRERDAEERERLRRAAAVMPRRG